MESASCLWPAAVHVVAYTTWGPQPRGLSGRAVSPAGCSTVPSASASRIFAEPGLQRLLLALVRRPAGQRDDLEGGRHAAVRQAESLAVDLERRAPALRGAAAAGGAARRTLAAPMARSSRISASGSA